MELTHLYGNTGKCCKQALFAIADNTKYGTTLREDIFYSGPIVFQGLVLYIPPKEIDLSVGIPEDGYTKPSPKVGGVHNYNRAGWKFGAPGNLVITQVLFDGGMAQKVLKTKLWLSLLVIYVILPDPTAEISGFLSSLIMKYVPAS
jgi:hypothetical protein